jgi:Na+-driven multidrug efflux pump
MGGLILSIFLLSLGVTFNGSLDTLISQAYGQKDLRLCRVYLNRQLYLTTMVFFALALPLIYTKEMVMSLGQDEPTATAAATYVHIMIPGGLVYSWQSCYSRFLSGQRITVISMYANISATLVHVMLALLLTVQNGMGIKGIAIASSTQFFVRYLVTITYVLKCGKFDDPDLQVPLLHEDSFLNWKQQFYLSLQCMSLSVWSWWAMDIFTLIASYMPSNVIAA